MIFELKCATCRHFINDKQFTCKAYPEGIPEDIISGKEDHTENLPGDNGIKYEEARA